MRTGRIERAVRGQLRRAHVKLEDAPLAAAAVTLAITLDGEVDTAKLATGSRELRMLLGELAGRGRGASPARAPAGDGSVPEPDLEPEVDPVDDLTARRYARRNPAG